MLKTEELIKLNLNDHQREMDVHFNRLTDRTVYDICDLNGRILQTGNIGEDTITIPLDKLSDDCYILLILDGDRVASKKFTLERV